jgi:excisionase family DNA binding protein
MFSFTSSDPEALLNDIEAARLLSLSSRTLQAWRLKGGGPPFVRLGRAVRYQRAALAKWMESNTVDKPPGRQAKRKRKRKPKG